MEHGEFVKGYRSGSVKAVIDSNASGFLYEQPGLIPHKYRKRQAMIRTLFLGGVALGIVLFFFVEWYFALVVFLIGLFMSTRATQAASKGVLETAIGDPEFYQMVTDKGILRVQHNI